MSATPSRSPRALAATDKNRSRKVAESLRRAFAEAAVDAEELTRQIRKLSKQFERAGQSNLLLNLLLSKKAPTFERLGLIERAFKIGVELGRASAVSDLIARRSAVGNLPVPAWGVDDQLGTAAVLGNDIFAQMAVLKYKGASNWHEDLFASAEKLSSRPVVPRRVLDRLHEVSRFPEIPKPVLEQHMRLALCVEHIFGEALGRARPEIDRGIGFPFAGALMRNVKPGSSEAAFDRINLARGALLMTFHGGFLTLAKYQFREHVLNGARFQAASAAGGGRISVQDDHRAALFQALRMLQDGGRLLMAPDAPKGVLNSAITVAGMTVPIAEGAAFLAFEAECDTYFYTFLRAGDRFVPHLVPGPRPGDGERYAAFKERLLDFYGRQITEIVTGEPWNLALRSRWMRLLERHSRDPAEP